MFRFALVFLALVSAIRSTDVESKIGQEVSSVPVQDDETQLPALIPIIKVDEIGLGQPAAGDTLLGSGQYLALPLPFLPRTYTANIYYPLDGNGALISALSVRIVTNQGSRVIAYTTAGGLRQHFVNLTITAENTKVFEYYVRIWGN